MKILMLCVANLARSQMAEGLARQLFRSDITVESAGSSPSSVNPFAVMAMEKTGIDIERHSSKSINDINLNQIDLIITLCKDEICPVTPKGAEHLHWPFDDPAGAPGSETDVLAGFERVRDEIREKLLCFGKERGYLS